MSDRFDRTHQGQTQTTAPLKGRPSLADAAKAGRLAQAHPPRQGGRADVAKTAGTPSSVGKAQA